MKKLSSLFVYLLFLQVLPAQENQFPDSWLGIYKGNLLMYNSHSQDADTVSILFEFLKTDKPGRWIHRMTYENRKFGKQVKDYELVKPDSLPVNMYLLDEKDGIFIQMVYLGNTIYAGFSVAGQYLTSVMRKNKNELIYEIFVSKDKPGLVSKNETSDTSAIFIVQSYPPIACQIARMLKIP